MYSTNSNPSENVDNNKILSIKRRKGKEDTSDTRTRPNKNKEHLLYKYSKQIPLAEAILINNWPVYLQIPDGKPILTENIELETTTLLPPSNSAYLSKEYVFHQQVKLNHTFKEQRLKPWTHCFIR